VFLQKLIYFLLYILGALKKQLFLFLCQRNFHDSLDTLISYYEGNAYCAVDIIEFTLFFQAYFYVPQRVALSLSGTVVTI
jgi:hypothetical protein